jgi:hypothetical protein
VFFSSYEFQNSNEINFDHSSVLVILFANIQSDRSEDVEVLKRQISAQASSNIDHALKMGVMMHADEN